MKLLVTGGAGFIGSNFIRMILRDDLHDVVNLDKLTYAGALENLKDVDKNPRYRFVKGDICDKGLVEELVKEADAVINFAAATHVDRSIVGDSSFVMSNIFGLYTLLEAARKSNVEKFIHIGTDEVYGSISDGTFVESDRLSPNSPYAASKAGADMLAMSFYKTYNIPLIITRSSNNFGPYQHPEKFIAKMIINAISGNELPVYGNGNNIRDWLFVEDNCRALLLLLDKGREGEIYNIAGGNEKRNIDVVEIILEILGRGKDLIKFVRDRPAHDLRYSISAKKISELGWKPSQDFHENLQRTIDWYRSNESWWKRILASTNIDFHKTF